MIAALRAFLRLLGDLLTLVLSGYTADEHRRWFANRS